MLKSANVIRLGAALILTTTATYAVLAIASAPTIAALVTAALVAAALCIAWLLGASFQARRAAVGLVLLTALMWLPRLFVLHMNPMEGLQGVAPSRTAPIAGLYVGILGILMFVAVGYGIALPLASAGIRIVWRRSTDAASSFLAHFAIAIAFVLAAILPQTPLWRDASFTALRSARAEVAHRLLNDDAETHPDSAMRGRLKHVSTASFPRLACCGNTTHILPGGEGVLFPMRPFGSKSWGYLYRPSGPPPAGSPFRQRAAYGDGWFRVDIDWGQKG